MRALHDTDENRMKKRLLPIPLILLIPIAMLVIVAVAGVYRFSLSDEEILAKFPSQQQKSDPILSQVFGLSTPNPWTIEVPQVHAFSFINELDPNTGIAAGHYDAGTERGKVFIDTRWLTQISPTDYVSSLSVSNQGSGVYYYVARFYYDQTLKRMVLKQSERLGDRIELVKIDKSGDQLRVEFRRHGSGQAMSESPSEREVLHFEVMRSAELALVE